MTAQAWTTLIVGILGIVGVIGTIRQRTIADARAQAWQRITWCLDHTVSENDVEAELGWRLYGTLTRSTLITKTEREVLSAAAQLASEQELARLGVQEDTGNHTDEESER